MTDYFSIADIRQAEERIRPYVARTPLEKSIYLSSEQQNVYLKLECHHPIRSFKIRGAFNRILQMTEEEKAHGIGAISSGNHGIAVAYATGQLGMEPAVVIVPENTPQSKIDKIRYYGGHVVLKGTCYDEAHMAGMEYIREHGYTFVDGGDEDPQVYAGQGTVALELLQQNPEIDTILAPIGGGGLAVGCAVAAKAVNPKIKIIALYSESCTAWVDSIRDHTPYLTYPSKESVCEAMIGGVGLVGYEMHHWIDDFLEVKESYIKEAVVYGILQEKIVLEATGAVPIAAVQQYGDRIPGKNIALILSGGNSDNEFIINQLILKKDSLKR